MRLRSAALLLRVASHNRMLPWLSPDARILPFAENRKAIMLLECSPVRRVVTCRVVKFHTAIHLSSPPDASRLPELSKARLLTIPEWALGRAKGVREARSHTIMSPLSSPEAS